MSGDALPTAVTVPTQETPNSISVAYTASDPLGPSQEGDKGTEELIAGEFKTQEEFLQAYAELKKQVAEGKGEEVKPEAGDTPEVEEEDDDDDGTPKVAGIEHTDEALAEFKEKGIDVKAYTRELEKTGKLSDESYAALEKAGYDRDMVDAYIQGQRVMVESQIKAVKDSIGGEEAFGKVAQWAAASLTEAEQTTYAGVLATNDVNLITFAVQGLKARYDAATGTDPEVVVSGSSSTANDGRSRFASWAENTKAMSDPRYNNDPAYRAAVEAKLLRSNI